MKKIISMLLLVMLLVGCSPKPEARGAGGMTDITVKSVVYRAVEQYEKQADPTIKTTTWEEETEVVDGITDGLYSINSQYEWDGRIYDLRLLMQQFPNEEYKLIRYHNITTGKDLD